MNSNFVFINGGKRMNFVWENTIISLIIIAIIVVAAWGIIRSIVKSLRK